MLTVVMLNVNTVSAVKPTTVTVIMLMVTMLTVVIMNAVMLGAMAPFWQILPARRRRRKRSYSVATWQTQAKLPSTESWQTAFRPHGLDLQAPGPVYNYKMF